MDDVHFNPVSGNWKLSKNDLGYYSSSARFYENGVEGFGFLFDLYEEFDGDEAALFRVPRTKAREFDGDLK